jgi:LmbE family N-acetylglucosaminyl deacetylase
MTVSFDHRTAGSAEASWASRLADLPKLDLPVGANVLVLAAHPDDETLGAGGLIARAAATGCGVTVVIATDGEASHPCSPSHLPGQLAAMRRAEVDAAVRTLAAGARLRLLHLPDGALTEHRDLLAAAIAEELSAADLVVSPWCGDGHPDHEACAEVVTQLLAARPHPAQHWQYPIWFWHWGDPDAALPHLARLDLDEDALAAKQRALDCHRSQHQPLSDAAGDEAILPPHVVARFRRDYECFVVTGAASEPGYFDELYRRSPDPWGLDHRFYEQRKRELVLASLPRPTFRRAFEPGCATGALTERLAGRCAEVVAWDGAAAGLAAARSRLAANPHVHLEQRRIPDDWPGGRFDLVVLSEVGYYCPDLDLLAARIIDALDADGVLLACHWRRPAPDHPHRAEDVHAAIGRELHRIVRHDEDDFLLEVWTRSGRSVASETGIVA